MEASTHSQSQDTEDLWEDRDVPHDRAYQVLLEPTEDTSWTNTTASPGKGQAHSTGRVPEVMDPMHMGSPASCRLFTILATPVSSPGCNWKSILRGPHCFQTLLQDPD